MKAKLEDGREVELLIYDNTGPLSLYTIRELNPMPEIQVGDQI